MIYLEKNDIHSTLCTWLYCHFWMLCSLEQRGEIGWIHWPKGKFLKSYEDDKKFAEKPNAYDWYFQQPNASYALEPIEETLTWEEWIDPSPISLMAMPLQFIKDYYKKHLHFNDETNARGQTIVDKYGIDFSKTIGITWRGTDVYLDGRPRIPIETYFPFIDEILKDNPEFSIMATAEEYGILEPIFDRYQNSFTIDEFISSPFMSKHNPERLSNVSGYERGLQPALMVWLFSKCKHYIKNRSSTGAVASWLSDGRIVSIFHPENLGFPANTSTIEINGRQYTTENKLIE